MFLNVQLKAIDSALCKKDVLQFTNKICKLVGQVSATKKTRFHFNSDDHSVISRVC